MTTNKTSKWDGTDYTTHGSFVPALGRDVLALLNPQPGERILDLGCGDGALTKQLADMGVDVLGVDASPELVEVAKSRGLDVRHGSGEALGFDCEFDAVFSNAALHWMLDAQAVADGVFRALKPGGRFVAEMGGFGNIAAVLTAIDATMKAHGYTYATAGQFYPTVSQYETIAKQAGFADFDGQIIPRPTPLASGMESWIRTFRQGYLDQFVPDEAEQQAIVDEVVALLKPNLCTVDGDWIADYVRLRFQALKPG